MASEINNCFSEVTYPYLGFSASTGEEDNLSFTTGAAGIVQQGWQYWKQEAAYYGQKAECLINFLYNIDPSFGEVEDVDVNLSGLSGIYRPTKPTEPTDPTSSEFLITIPNLADPYAVDWEDPDEITFDAEKNYPTVVYDFDGLPLFDVDDPTYTIDFQDPTVPDDFTETVPDDTNNYDIDEAPDVYEFIAPLKPTINAYTFTASPPSELVVDELEITYSEDSYSSTLLTELSTTAYNWLQGGTGVPENIWNLIWDNARENEENSGQKLLKETTEEWSSRGFTLKSGLLDKKLTDIRKEISNKTSTINREIAIKYYEAEMENIRQAMVQGIALEGILIDNFNKKWDRQVQIEGLYVQAYTALWNARVSALQANVSIYKAQADVYKAKLDGERLKIDNYKAQIEAEVAALQASKIEAEIYQTKADVVKTKAEVYNTIVTAYNAKVTAYNAQVAAYKTKVDAEVAKLEEAKVSVEVYANEVAAYKTKVDAYSSKMQAQSYKSDVFLNAVKAYEADVDAWAKRQNSKISIADSKNKINEVYQDQYASQVNAFTARLNNEAERIKALIGMYGIISENYSSKVKAEEVLASSTTAIYNAEVNLRIQKALVELKRAEQNITQIIEEAKILSENARTAATVYGSIGSSTMAAVGLTANIQDHANNAYGVDYNYNKNYECESAC